MAKYEACIARMEALRELGVKKAEVFGDSTLVIAQMHMFRLRFVLGFLSFNTIHSHVHA